MNLEFFRETPSSQLVKFCPAARLHFDSANFTMAGKPRPFVQYRQPNHAASLSRVRSNASAAFLSATTAVEAGRLSVKKLSLLQLLHPVNIGQKFQVLHSLETLSR